MGYWFELGFMSKCAECGIDPYSAGVLYKSAVTASPPSANVAAQTAGSFARPQPTAPVPTPATAPGKPTAPVPTPATAPGKPTAPVPTPAPAPTSARPATRPAPAPVPTTAKTRPYEDIYDRVSPTHQAMIRGLWNEQDQYARQTEAENAKKQQQEQFRTDFSGMDAAGQYDALMKMSPEQRREYARTLSPYRQQQIRAVQAQRSGQKAQPGQIGGWSKADQWAAMPAKDKYRILQNAKPEQRELLRKYTSQNDYDEIMRLHRQKKYNDALSSGDFDAARSVTL